jgi:polysaccharide biosynthesis transport protein
MNLNSKVPFSKAETNGKHPLPVGYAVSTHATQAAETDEGWKLSRLVAIARRRSLLMIAVAVAGTAVSWGQTLTRPPEYRGFFQILVEPETLNAGNLAGLNQDNSSSGGESDYTTQIRVLQSPKLLDPIVTKIRNQYPNMNYGALVGQLTVAQPTDTKILEITYRGADPDQVEFVLDLLSEEYLRYSDQERQTTLRQGIRFVNDQIAQMQKRVDTLQRQLQGFRQDNEFINPEDKSAQVSGQLDALQQQSMDTDKQMAEAQQQYANIAEQTGALETLETAATYQKLLQDLRLIESKIATESVRFKPNNPAIQALEQQRNNLLPLLRDEAERALGAKLAAVENQLSILRVRQTAIATARTYWKAQANRLPITTRQYTDMQRELNVATESLNRFLATREQLQVEAAQKEVPWQLITPPGTAGLTTASTSRGLILGAMTGVLLSVAAAFIAEKIDNTFQTTEDLKKQIQLPILGVIPYHITIQDALTPLSTERRLQTPERDRRVLTNPFRKPATDNHFLFSEAFRSLYANLRLLNSDSPLRSLVVSSALPGDGKSTVALYLAQAAAAMGLRVLLVDADLRRPQITNLLGLPNDSGLSDLVVMNLHPSQAIQTIRESNRETSQPLAPDAFAAGNSPPVTIEDRLFVLGSGQLAADPTRLFSAAKMGDLAEHFQTLFDLVIYDSPPVLSLADSSLLTTYTDGLLLVTNLGRTDRAALMDALDALQVANVPVLGLVANGLRNQTTPVAGRYAERPTAPVG